MATFVDLPQELVDQVVGEYAQDRAYLRVCALISSAFLPPSRTHLFSSLRITPGNIYPFRSLIASSTSVAWYVQRLEVPGTTIGPPTILPVETIARLPNLKFLVCQADPFDFRQIHSQPNVTLAPALQSLTSLQVSIDRLWTIPYWVALLDACPALTDLTVHAEATGWGQWTYDDLTLSIPPPPPPPARAPRLRAVRITGDCKILVPLNAWFLSRGSLSAVETLYVDLLYMLEDYDAADQRLPMLRAVMATVRDLTVNLDPPISLEGEPGVSAARMPHLRTLRIRDGSDARLSESIDWLAGFLSTTPVHGESLLVTESPLEELSLDHHVRRQDLTAVNPASWAAIDSALSASHPGTGVSGDCTIRYPSFRAFTFSGFQKYVGRTIHRHDKTVFAHFLGEIQDRLPTLVEREQLRVES